MEFFERNQLYIVLIIVLTIWFGFLAYLFRLDKRIRDLEESFKK